MLAILWNGIVMLAEIAATAGVAALGYHYPALFAAVTAGLALVLGVALERARLQNEVPFYFEGEGRWRAMATWLMAVAEALVKALLAGVAALLTFSGTDQGRLLWVAVVFGVVVYLGAWVSRSLSISLGARPLRWGWFRLALPLGLVVSLALSFLPQPSFSDLGRKLIFELPQKPSLAQASEMLFVLKQKFDDLVAALLSWIVPIEWAQVLGALVSVNVLTGFVAAIYAVVIAEGVRRAGG
jgi:hypothetical protein